MFSTTYKPQDSGSGPNWSQFIRLVGVSLNP